MRTVDIVFGILVVVVGIGLLIWYIRQRRARSHAVEEWAGREGWTPVDRNDPRAVEALRGSAIGAFYGRVYDPCSRSGSPEALLFEFAYTIGPTGNRDRVRQTVVAISSLGAHGRLMAKARSNERAGRLARNAASPTGRAGFDERFEVEAIDDAPPLPEPLLDRLLGAPTPPVIEAGNGWMMVYRPGRLMAPSDLNAAVDEANELHRLMVG